jgi:hypothetical protein
VKTKKNKRFKNKFAVVLKYLRMIDIIYIKQQEKRGVSDEVFTHA